MVQKQVIDQLTGRPTEIGLVWLRKAVVETSHICDPSHQASDQGSVDDSNQGDFGLVTRAKAVLKVAIAMAVDCHELMQRDKSCSEAQAMAAVDEI